MPFTSFSPIETKRGVVRGEFVKINRLVSTHLQDEEREKAFNLFETSGYPRKFVRKHARVKDESRDEDGAEDPPILLSLPFKGDTANTILRHKLGKLTKETFPGRSLRLVSKTKRLISDRNKDRTSWHEQKGVVYEFVCACGERYIGMTTRPLLKRINEHLKTDKASSVLQHLTSSKHQVGRTTFPMQPEVT